MRFRFTAWLSEGEREAIRRTARENGTSENYVVRIALRAAFGMPIPVDALGLRISEQEEVEA